MKNLKKQVEWLISEWEKRPNELRKTNWDIWLFKQQVDRNFPEMLEFKDLISDKYEYLKIILKLEEFTEN